MSEARGTRTPVVRGRDGARLRVIDFGGEGRPVLFVHGLAGHGSEWSRVAQLLPRELRPLAFDLRGHGGSERRPGDASLAAHADDVARVAGQMAPGEPLFLVGQSVGGIVAFVAASRRPEIVRALVVVEAAPTGPHPEAPARISGWLDSWPSPFSSAFSPSSPPRGAPRSFAPWWSWRRPRPDLTRRRQPGSRAGSIPGPRRSRAAGGRWPSSAALPTPTAGIPSSFETTLRLTTSRASTSRPLPGMPSTTRVAGRVSARGPAGSA